MEHCGIVYAPKTFLFVLVFGSFVYYQAYWNERVSLASTYIYNLIYLDAWYSISHKMKAYASSKLFVY